MHVLGTPPAFVLSQDQTLHLFLCVQNHSRPRSISPDAQPYPLHIRLPPCSVFKDHFLLAVAQGLLYHDLVILVKSQFIHAVCLPASIYTNGFVLKNQRLIYGDMSFNLHCSCQLRQLYLSSASFRAVRCSSAVSSAGINSISRAAANPLARAQQTWS